MNKKFAIFAFVCVIGLFFACQTTNQNPPKQEVQPKVEQKQKTEQNESDLATTWQTDDLKVYIQPIVRDKAMDIKFTCVNNTSHTLWIPKFFVTFTTKVQDKNIMKSNWLTIINQKDSQALYKGIFLEPDKATLWQKSNCIVLKAGSSYSFTIGDVQNHYYISNDSTMLTVQYQGPLGNSNKSTVSY